MIHSCNLQFFYLEDRAVEECLGPAASTQPFACLQGQRDLRALALQSPIFESGSTQTLMIRGAEGKNAWPNLKALYHLRQRKDTLTDQFPACEQLQNLCLKNMTSGCYFSSHGIERIAECQNLQVLDVEFFDFARAGVLLIIARGCPFLQKLTLRHTTVEQ